MKHILVPVDFSKHSAYALEVAAGITRQQKADITVIHMIGISEAVIAEEEFLEYEEAKYFMGLAKQRFKSFLDKPYLKGIVIHKIVQNYKVFSELNHVAKEQNIDLIVMGSHGSTGFNEIFIGSNAEKVVRTSDVPVLIIKQQNSDFRIKNILFGCSFSEDMVLAYRKVKSMAQKFSAKLKLVYINTPFEDFLSTPEAEKRIADFMSKAQETNYKVEIYNDYTVENGLLNFTKTEKFDLLALPTHGRKGLAHFLLGSIGEDIANHAKLPVMTLKI
ncbi:universal stress protein [Arenibacter sp. BSSL-BM3]|uniref:Universal stress protein n=1 Tax=Arenibacter arenosicollis TaxID=2762274 RepID=A0ABR7QN73_9FLAO|nr:universal stress protein [Arenibacter arenosicollis]MBC8768654.1 universal stress protein [Arenibacter arenosicollis]